MRSRTYESPEGSYDNDHEREQIMDFLYLDSTVTDLKSERNDSRSNSSIETQPVQKFYSKS